MHAFLNADLLAETRRQWQAIGIVPESFWLEQLGEILQDVHTGDHVTLFVDAEGTSTFYVNNVVSSSIEDAQFSRQQE